ncbi:MAG: 2,4-dihydroxyhept-2-ene-1,7-dioic acid aldolase [Chloroflexi bacterium]|nr:2,4-dihydroxyhept-2-ene-1,7-dioic acid aldolase [Chloroflexota bacterium]
MKLNTAKQLMLQGQPAFGYGLSLGSPLAAEALSKTGIDFLLVDTQHGSNTPESTTLAFLAISAGSAIPMARVAFNNYTLTGRLLDEGALGIVVPLVNSVEDARAVVAACHFPPRGQRSWGWGRAAAYGPDYPDWIDEQLFVAVQIESKQAADNAEAILAVDGIDGCWIGPADLALSMGIRPTNAAYRDEHARAIERVLEACRDTGKVPGIATGSPEEARRRAEQGFRFLTAGGDLGFMLGGALTGLRTLGRA